MLNNEEILNQIESYHQKSLNNLSSAFIKTEEETNLDKEMCNLVINEIEESSDRNLLLQQNFFKECKVVLNQILGRIETKAEEHFAEHPSIIQFKKESISILNSYIDSARIEHNNAIESSRLQSENISNQIITKRINLFNQLQMEYEELEVDLLEYWGF